MMKINFIRLVLILLVFGVSSICFASNILFEDDFSGSTLGSHWGSPVFSTGAYATSGMNYEMTGTSMKTTNIYNGWSWGWATFTAASNLSNVTNFDVEAHVTYNADLPQFSLHSGDIRMLSLERIGTSTSAAYSFSSGNNNGPIHYTTFSHPNAYFDVHFKIEARNNYLKGYLNDVLMFNGSLSTPLTLGNNLQMVIGKYGSASFSSIEVHHIKITENFSVPEPMSFVSIGLVFIFMYLKKYGIRLF